MRIKCHFTGQMVICGILIDTGRNIYLGTEEEDLSEIYFEYSDLSSRQNMLPKQPIEEIFILCNTNIEPECLLAMRGAALCKPPLYKVLHFKVVSMRLRYIPSTRDHARGFQNTVVIIENGQLPL